MSEMNNNSAQFDFTYNLTADQVDQIEQLQVTRPRVTMQELLEQALSLGLTQLVYRSKHNKERWQEQKAERAELEQLRELFKQAGHTK